MRVDKTDVMQRSMAAAENGTSTAAQKSEADSAAKTDTGEVKSVSAAQMSFPGDDIKERQDAAKKKSWALDPSYHPALMNLDSFGTVFSNKIFIFDETDEESAVVSKQNMVWII